MDYPDVASLAMPAALLVINGRRDTLFEPQGVTDAFDKLAACYRKAGASEKLRTRLYDTPHEFKCEGGCGGSFPPEGFWARTPLSQSGGEGGGRAAFCPTGKARPPGLLRSTGLAE
jgi:hypothetical protein